MGSSASPLVLPRCLTHSDGNDVHPEANVVRLVSRITVDLLLDPVDCCLVVWSNVVRLLQASHKKACRWYLQARAKLTVDVFSIRVRQAGGPIAMSSKPLGVTVVVDAVSASLNVGVQVHAMVLSAIGISDQDYGFPYFKTAPSLNSSALWP